MKTVKFHARTGMIESNRVSADQREGGHCGRSREEVNEIKPGSVSIFPPGWNITQPNSDESVEGSELRLHNWNLPRNPSR